MLIGHAINTYVVYIEYFKLQAFLSYGHPFVPDCLDKRVRVYQLTEDEFKKNVYGW